MFITMLFQLVVGKVVTHCLVYIPCYNYSDFHLDYKFEFLRVLEEVAIDGITTTVE